MYKNRHLEIKASVKQKIALFLFGAFLFFVLLEISLRLGGFIVMSSQERRNLQSIKQKGAYRILCLGESTTERQFPSFLEKILEKRDPEMLFSVVDKGRTGTNTAIILSRVEGYLEEYRPDMVIAMMGSNDEGVRYYQGMSGVNTWMFQHCRTYRFIRLIFMHILKKIVGEDIYGDNKLNLSQTDKLSDQTRISEEKIQYFNESATESSINVGSDLNYKRPFELEEIFKKELKRNPRNDNIYVGLGDLYRDQRKFYQAEEAFKKAIEFNPRNELAHTGLVWLYREQGKFLKAEEAFKKAIELNPQNDTVYVGLVWLYEDQNKSTRLENLFKKAIKLYPKNDTVYVGLGWLYQQQKRILESEAAYKKAIEINPRSDCAYLGLGWLYQDEGDFYKTEAAYKKAIEINPRAEFAYVGLGWLYRENGKFTQAEELFKKAIKFNPNERMYGAISALYGEMGKPKLAKKYADIVGKMRTQYQALMTVNNYRKLKKILDKRGIKLVCVQYPMHKVEPLKKIFDADEDIIFVDNERIFKEAVKKEGYREYFRDMFGGDFGHCTDKGNQLLAQNIASAILKKVFDKQ